MAKLTFRDVKHVAKLANLPLTKKEIGKFKKQLGEIIEYINELSEVDTSSIEPTSQTTGLTNVTRNDVIKGEFVLSVKDATSGKDDTHNDYFVVPMLLKKRKG